MITPAKVYCTTFLEKNKHFFSGNPKHSGKFRILGLLTLGCVGMGMLFLSGCEPGQDFSYAADFFSMDTVVTAGFEGGKEETLENTRTLLEGLDGALNPYWSHGNGISSTNLGGVSLANQLSLTAKHTGGQPWPVELDPEVGRLLAQTLALTHRYPSVNPVCGALTRLWNGDGSGLPLDSLPSEEAILEAVSLSQIERLTVTGSNPNEVTLFPGATLDFGAVAKGYACDKVGELWRSEGVTAGIFSMGSSSYMTGKNPRSKEGAYRIAIDHPDKEGYAARFEVSGESENEAGAGIYISTSGGSERFSELEGKRYIHIIDLASGYPSSSDLSSVTVLAKTGVSSDFLSTAILLKGSEGLKSWLAADELLEFAAVGDGVIYHTPGLNLLLEDKSFRLETIVP